MARLIISSPDGKKGVLELTKAVTTLGRGNANDLVLNDASVSRFHAVVKLHDDQVLVADRGSTNGVVINGERIEQEQQRELQNGDVMHLGQYELRLELVDEKDIHVRHAEWPSTMNHIMRGRTGQAAALWAGTEFAGSAVSDLAGRVKKLERENYLLTVL